MLIKFCPKYVCGTVNSMTMQFVYLLKDNEVSSEMAGELLTKLNNELSGCVLASKTMYVVKNFAVDKLCFQTPVLPKHDVVADLMSDIFTNLVKDKYSTKETIESIRQLKMDSIFNDLRDIGYDDDDSPKRPMCQYCRKVNSLEYEDIVKYYHDHDDDEEDEESGKNEKIYDDNYWQKVLEKKRTEMAKGKEADYTNSEKYGQRIKMLFSKSKSLANLNLHSSDMSVSNKTTINFVVGKYFMDDKVSNRSSVINQPIALTPKLKNFWYENAKDGDHMLIDLGTLHNMFSMIFEEWCTYGPDGLQCEEEEALFARGVMTLEHNLNLLVRLMTANKEIDPSRVFVLCKNTQNQFNYGFFYHEDPSEEESSEEESDEEKSEQEEKQ